MAGQRASVPKRLAAPGVLAIIRGAYEPGELREVAAALRDGGVEAVELALNSPGALAGIAALAALDGLTVGAGTVLTPEQARAAVDAGASFLVMPHVDPDLLDWAAAEGLPSFPGALTPTEVLTAWRAGAAAVKLFPGALDGVDGFGPAYLSALRGPLPDIPFLPTGGVTDLNAEAFVAAGALGVAAGSWLVPSRAQDADPATVRARAAVLVDAVAAGRARTPTPTGAPV